MGTYTGNSGGNLCGWWRLNENVSSTGDITDSSGNGRDGTFLIANNRPGYSTFTPGIIQEHTNTFDGTNNVFVAGLSSTWDSLIGTAGTNQMSFAAWVYLTNDALTHYLLRFSNGSLEIYTQLTSRRIRFRRSWSPTAGVWESTDALPLNTWVHVAITYDATSTENTPNIFINGTQNPLNTLSAPEGSLVALNVGDAYIGGSNVTSGYQWQGNLADVAIWNNILSDTDIAAIHAAAVGPNYYTYRNFDLIGYGERLSPTGSQYQLSLQGINTQPDDIYFPSLLPRVRQGAPVALWRRGEKISDKYFDDTISLPHSGSKPNLRGQNDVKLSTRINFDWEQLNFGQAPTVQQGESFVETNRFNAVDYIQVG